MRIQKTVLVGARNQGVMSQFSFFDPMVAEALGVIGAVLKSLGCEVVWIDEAIDHLDPKSSLWQLVVDADLFCVSAMTHTEGRAVELARFAKIVNQNIFCVAGGPGPTSNPGKALATFNVVVMAQGVHTIVDLVRCL
ncbi:MAG: hypothetical protein COT91_02380 [Candidatus Doudnabacteria bacterium CG10_big_fil_rev_8_21_14_0_10_41_10]|uniref:B12-binding domain-containing protein n=1 Tax=Candidatus Doudnabacteria bacterium CG10_big_fil_rev_8_21_14_0_10_41_10 TaxID=1974551 RepID=A0A2H0VDV4_9BACT|nr:MAG: hypothetical protein COT91_02380 [Candidatus Doudnabacteria bacterium CG10_big_fil_rev_8_21_14_0_10_41_10]